MGTLTDTAAAFAGATAGHVLEVRHDYGAYKHVRGAALDHPLYPIDVHAAPGMVTAVTPGGGWSFCGPGDVLAWLRASLAANGGQLDAVKWAEMVGGRPVRAYSAERFAALIREELDVLDVSRPGVVAAWEEHVDGVLGHSMATAQDARYALEAFTFGGPGPVLLPDDVDWEEALDWDPSYVWACHAIAWALGAYDRRPAHRVG